MSNYLPVRTESTFTEKALDSNFNRRSRQRGPKVLENITQGTQNNTTQTRNKEKHQTQKTKNFT